MFTTHTNSEAGSTESQEERQGRTDSYQVRAAELLGRGFGCKDSTVGRAPAFQVVTILCAASQLVTEAP